MVFKNTFFEFEPNYKASVLIIRLMTHHGNHSLNVNYGEAVTGMPKCQELK